MKSDRVIASIMLAFIIFWGFLTTKLPESTMEGEPGPKFFPLVILGLMAIFSVILFLKPTKVEQSDTTESSPGLIPEVLEDEEEETPAMKRILFFYGVFLVAIILTYYLGFIVGFIIGMTALLNIAGWRLFPRATVFAVAMTVGVYLLFDTLLKIPLPTGTLF